MSMGLLILSPNLIRLLLGWDGLGVTSYLLVIFYQRKKSYRAGILTALTNRMGDVGILICIGLISFIGSWTFRAFTNASLLLTSSYICILVLSACTKRAQIPFSSWLPAAIAAPTPVSALVHSSTLVTAGVYLLVRFGSLFATHWRSYALYLIGSLTMIIAGLAAIGEIDIKKVIALSTLRQLGVIILTLGLGSPKMAFFHLLSHAYFKAILFMCAGRVIHTIKDYQDIRTIRRGHVASVKVLAIVIVANLSLCGFPFLSGFYSKDLILESGLIINASWIRVTILGMGTLLTVAYRIRALSLVLSGDARGDKVNFTRDRDVWMVAGMLCLFPFSILAGYFLSHVFIASSSLIFLPLTWKLFIPLIIVLGSGLGYSSSTHHTPLKFKWTWFLRKIWFIPLTFSYSSTKLSLYPAQKIFSLVENAWLLHTFLLFPTTRLRRPGWVQTHLNNFSYMRALIIVPIVIIFI